MDDKVLNQEFTRLAQRLQQTLSFSAWRRCRHTLQLAAVQGALGLQVSGRGDCFLESTDAGVEEMVDRRTRQRSLRIVAVQHQAKGQAEAGEAK